MAQRREHVVETFFEAWSQTYDAPALQEAVYLPMHRILETRLLALSRGGPVNLALDAGVGTGQTLPWLTHRARHAVGVDVSAHMLQRARQREGDAWLLRAGAQAIPLKDGCVDMVVSCFYMHWWPDIAQGWREIHRVLRPGGHALITVPTAAVLALPVVRGALAAGAVVHWLTPREYNTLGRKSGLTMRFPQPVMAAAWLLEGRKDGP